MNSDNPETYIYYFKWRGGVTQTQKVEQTLNPDFEPKRVYTNHLGLDLIKMSQQFS